MTYEGKPVDFDEKDGPQCADLSASNQECMKYIILIPTYWYDDA